MKLTQLPVFSLIRRVQTAWPTMLSCIGPRFWQSSIQMRGSQTSEWSCERATLSSVRWRYAMAGWTMALAAVCSAALFVVTDSACARSSLNGGNSIGFQSGRNFGARASVDRGTLPSGWVDDRFCAPGCRASPRHRIRNLAARTRDNLLLGGYGPAGNTEPYDGDDTGENFSPAPSVSTDFAPTALRPTCKWETQTRVVPSEAGGARKVAIIRCVSAERPSGAEADTHTIRELHTITDGYRVEMRRPPQESNSEPATPQ
jgi:hypothetical protein